MIKRLLTWIRAKYGKRQIERLRAQRKKASDINPDEYDGIAQKFVSDCTYCGSLERSCDDPVEALDGKHFDHLSREVDPMEHTDTIPPDSVKQSCGDISPGGKPGEYLERSAPPQIDKPDSIKKINPDIPTIVNPPPEQLKTSSKRRVRR